MAEETEVKKSGGKGMIIILLVVVILLLVGMGAMAYLLLNAQNPQNAATEEVHAQLEEGNNHTKNYSPKYKQYEAPAADAAPNYFVMDKFVVNFNGDGKAKFLAVDLQFMTFYPQVVTDMEPLRPILKNDIQRLLRNQHYNDLITAEGPDKLRADLLVVVRQVLEQHKIYPELVEDVYMTRFVMQ
ncbi:MAG: flagellar basal body-associated FliL family protein [Thiotrichales bacterium]|nr:flagellar basal body-associated FliL family protein [Thiotrichales bacterium]